MHVETAHDRDHEFDGNSRIVIDRLTPSAIDDLVTLAKVWGFLKVHHPDVVSGRHHWDYELFGVMPRVLAAPSQGAANEAVAAWATALGGAPPCSPCAASPEGRPVLPRLGWIRDRGRLGDVLAEFLGRTYTNRATCEKQFYVSLVERVGNPDFSNELAYADEEIPDVGYRLLALFRVWNIVEYWFPYRDLIDEDWDGMLREFIPRVIAADTRERYRLEMMALFVRTCDGHATLWELLAERPPQGPCASP